MNSLIIVLLLWSGVLLGWRGAEVAAAVSGEWRQGLPDAEEMQEDRRSCI